MKTLIIAILLTIAAPANADRCRGQDCGFQAFDAYPFTYTDRYRGSERRHGVRTQITPNLWTFDEWDNRGRTRNCTGFSMNGLRTMDCSR